MIKKYFINTITVVAIVLIIGAIFTGVATAANQVPTPPPTPSMVAKPTPTPTGGGGGGSGGTISAPQEIWPKVFQVKNSSGATIGSVTANSYNDITAHVVVAGTIDGQNATIIIDAKLSTLPTSDLRMDLSFETPDATRLPDVLHVDKTLTQINITRCSGWNIQGGSFHVTVKLPDSVSKGLSADERYYFVRVDGANAQLLKANVAGSGNGTITYDVISPNEYLSPTSVSMFELTAMLPASATPTPTATPTIPAATPTPTPEPGGLGLSTFTLLIMVFIPALIAGLIIVYYEMLRKK